MRLDAGGDAITSARCPTASSGCCPVLDSVDEGDYLAIPDFGGGISDMKINDVSADGIILVGTGNTKTGLKAFRADTTVVDEDGVPIPVQLTIQDAVTLQTLRSSSAQAVSADGIIIAGYGSTKTANRAFVTTVLDATTDPITLESTILPMLGGGKFAEAYAMTAGRRHHRRPQRQPQGPRGLHLVRGRERPGSGWSRHWARSPRRTRTPWPPASPIAPDRRSAS